MLDSLFHTPGRTARVYLYQLGTTRYAVEDTTRGDPSSEFRYVVHFFTSDFQYLSFEVRPPKK